MKIIVYDDNPGFGGHQVMAAHGIEALAAESAAEIVCMIHPGNQRLADRLTEIARIHRLDSPGVTRPLQGLRNRIDRREIRAIGRLFSRLQPDLVLCIQGDVEQSSMGLLAAAHCGIPVVSYLALPHTLKAMGARLGAWRDPFNQYLLRLPCRYIVISEGMADLLRSRGARQRIDVVPNGIITPSPAPAPSPDRSTSFTVGMLGRIEFSQKQHDFVLRAWTRRADVFGDCRLLIAGDGPDRAALESMVASSPARSRISLTDWQNDPQSFYASIDMLLIPSRYEGVPLVMLEALARGLPVLGSSRDGMRELLPAEWTFEAGNTDAMADAVVRLRQDRQEAIVPLQQRVLAEYSMHAFRENFRSAVLGTGA